MLTVDYDHLDVRAGDRLLDLGCGGGRHSYEALRRGAQVVALDSDEGELCGVHTFMAAMREQGEVPTGVNGSCLRADGRRLPFADATFDRVIAAEVLEHIEQDVPVFDEIHRVLRPGGRAAVTVPRFWPELLCWMLSRPYHEVEGGHVRIYRRGQVRGRAREAGLTVSGSHHAHALHSLFWWLKCAVGVERDVWPVRAYHRMLVWDLMRAPALTRITESLLDPFMGKSLVLYLERPGSSGPEGRVRHGRRENHVMSARG